MKNIPNLLGALILVLGGIAHLGRYLKQWPITVDEFVVPISWSLPAGILMLLIGLWMLLVLKK